MDLKKMWFAFGVVLLLFAATMQCATQGHSSTGSSSVVSATPFECVSSTNNVTTYYAVICACSRYENPKYNLPRPFPAPESKLQVLYEALTQTTNWEKDHILLLLNQNATRQTILQALDLMSVTVGPNDVFLFSWNGHGSEVPDNDGDEARWDPDDTHDEVICPYDTEKINGNFTNVITDDELGFYFSKIHGRGTCLIFESCLSGALVDRKNQDLEGEQGYKTGVVRDITPRAPMDVDGNDTVVLMSTLPTTLGRATYLTHAPLISSMAWVISHREKYDKNNDGVLSAEEMFRASRPLTFIQSSLLWLPLFITAYILYKFDLYNLFSFLPRYVKIYESIDTMFPMPLLLSFGVFVSGFMFVEILQKLRTGHFF
jgi:hypothetical protein